MNSIFSMILNNLSDQFYDENIEEKIVNSLFLISDANNRLEVIIHVIELMCEHSKSSDTENVLNILCNNIMNLVNEIKIKKFNDKKNNELFRHISRGINVLTVLIRYRNGSQISDKSIVLNCLKNVIECNILMEPLKTENNNNNNGNHQYNKYQNEMISNYLYALASLILISKSTEISNNFRLEIQHLINLCFIHITEPKLIFEFCLWMTSHDDFVYFFLNPLLKFIELNDGKNHKKKRRRNFNKIERKSL